MGKHLGEARRREDILSAAKSLFVEKGYPDSSLEDIATAAGISRGGMYFYYRNKEEILIALCEQEVSDSLEFLLNALKGPMANPQTLLGSILAYYVQYLARHPKSTAISLLLAEASLRNETVQALLARNMKDLENMLTELLENSGILEQGPLKSFTARDVAVLISIVVEGVKTRYLVTQDAEGIRQTISLLTSVAFGGPTLKLAQGE